MNTKVCNNCKEEKEVSEFYIKNKSKDGFACVCKKCCEIKRKLVSTEIKEEIIEKLCNKCSLKKPISKFSKVNTNKDGYCNICSDCKKYEKGEKIYESNLKINLKGLKHSYIEVLKYEYSIYDGVNKLRQYWRFKCICGKEFIKRRDYFTRKSNVKSCGCYKKPVQTSLIPYYNQYKSSAKKRKLIFDLTIDDFEKLIKGNCKYCNSTPNEFIYKAGNYETTPIMRNGIDRINSDIGYSMENCVSCCTKCNRCKMDLTVNDWLDHMKKILNNLNIQL